ncbi:tautomerase [Halolamina litorea]|uniref:Tautomerase n=1 Tax=Halolamina litorea TaxID=1515593 RepID=A0ABD6BSP2_9EURY|nr:tautomerase [Halolamina litorea]
MPLLTITASVDPGDTQSFLADVADLYADSMDSEMRFLTANFRHSDREGLWLGRADPDEPVVLLEADIREGRPADQRRSFALAFMEHVRERWGVPEANMKVVFTEHEGAHLMGYDRVGGDWEP